jgi:hypothetical protein
MEQGGLLLPTGFALLGVSALAGFMAFRPWPVGTSGSSLKPGTYAVEILQGKPPPASNAPDRKAQITTIEGGLATLLGVWAVSKFASSLPVGGIGTGPSGAEETTAGSEVEGDVAKIPIPEVP